MNIPNDYAQVNFKFTGAAVPEGAQTTLGLNVELYAGSPEDLADFLAAELAGSDLMTYTSSQCSLTAIYLRYGPTPLGPSYEYAYNLPGSASGDPLPPNVSVLAKKVTGIGGRANRGRFYWPAPTESQTTGGGQLSAQAFLDFTNAFNSFHGKLLAEDLLPVVLHGPGSPMTVPTPIISFVAEKKMATQRRRLR